MGRVEIWRSLATDSPIAARRRAPYIAACIEAEIELARSTSGLPFDATLLQPSKDDPADGAHPFPRRATSVGTSLRDRAVRSPTFGEAYAAYLADPTHGWSARTREAYDTSHRLAVSVIGADTPIGSLSRVHLRDYIDVLRFLPRNAAKRFPRLSARAASELARRRDDIEPMSAANANVCLANLSSFLNWAVNEELLVRNPARGLRLPDDTAKRDKRRSLQPRAASHHL